jgi:hypothetical protein
VKISCRLVGTGHARDSCCQPPNRGHGPFLQTVFVESLNSYEKRKVRFDAFQFKVDDSVLQPSGFSIPIKLSLEQAMTNNPAI